LFAPVCDERAERNNAMEKLRGPHILERGERFLRVWKHQAPEQERFAGIDHEQLQAGVDAAKEARERVRAVEVWLRSLRLERDQAEQKLARQLMRVASGVRAEPAYGEDSGFYRALGFVPISENRSGRPRKQTATRSRDKKKS
jgi:hypothetical protein